MLQHSRLALLARLLVVVLLGCCSLAVASALAGEPTETLRFGVARSLFRDLPESSWGVGMRLFKPLMRVQTGLECELESPADSEELAEKLLSKKLDMAIFQGVEFAWERQKHPELRPLVILINLREHRQSYLVVRQGSAASRWCDLKGKTLALPLHSREHLYAYLEGQCRHCGGDVQHFFKKTTRPACIEDALDDVAEGQVDAALVDGVGFDAYKRRKPGRSAGLKELSKSEPFPDTVVAYRAGAIDDSILKRCREGLLKADQSLEGRLLLMFWRVTAFRPAPDDFDRLLADIARAYPAADHQAAEREKKEKVRSRR